MISSKYSMAALVAGALTLSACTEPGQLGAGPNDPNQKTKNGALIGAASGAVLGALTGDDGNRGDRALAGALLGGAVGAGVGYSLDKQEAELRRQMDSRVVITNTGDRLIVTLPQDITFATDSTAVQPGIQDDLRALAQNVQIYANSKQPDTAGQTAKPSGRDRDPAQPKLIRPHGNPACQSTQSPCILRGLFAFWGLRTTF